MNNNIGKRKSKGRIRKGNCIQCGKPFEQVYISGSKQKYCNKKCADRASYERQKKKHKRICKKCNKRFNTSIKNDEFCGMDCSNNYIMKRECISCGNIFKGTRRVKYCSEECRKEIRVCPVCNEKFKELPHSKTIYCSDNCHKESISLYRSNCIECGTRFKGRKSRANLFCSRECYHKSLGNNGWVPHKTINSTTDYGSKKRAKKYGVEVENINIKEVFERDEWVCGICNEKVDKNIPYPNSQSASLDHVIPMSKGGGHTYDNVQLSHLRCNLRKSNVVENTN